MIFEFVNNYTTFELLKLLVNRALRNGIDVEWFEEKFGKFK